MGVLLLGATVVSLAVVASLLASCLGLRSLGRYVLASYAIAWAVLVLVTVALSSFRGLDRWRLAGGIAALAGLAGALWLRRGRPRPPGWDAAWSTALRDPVVRVLALALLPATVYLAALAFFTTPNDWDGLTYHETRALLWDQQGGVGYVASGDDPRLNGNPPVSEIGVYLAMATARSERFAALPQFFALAACVLAVVLVGRRSGFSRPAAAYGGLVFATFPIVFLEGASILNDLVVASFLLGAAFFLLGRTRTELALGSLCIGLALSTKLNAVFALPVLLAVAVVGAPDAASRGRAVAAWGAGLLLGSPWYVLNLAETGTPDGGIGDEAGQVAEHSFAAVVGTFRALAFDVVDTSGIRGSDVFVAIGIGAALAGAAAIRAWRGRPAEWTTALLWGGAVTATVPLLLGLVRSPAEHGWEHLWLAVGRDDVARALPHAWEVNTIPDTSLSWFGAAGAIVVAGAPTVTFLGVRRGGLRPVTLVYALAPWAMIAIFSVAIVYDPWRGRLLIFGVGLAAAAWSSTHRVRWLATGVTALCVITVFLSLLHSYTKPAGRRVLESPISHAVWGMDRIETLTIVRNADGTRELLRALEEYVPPDAELAVALPFDSYIAPLAGPRLSRRIDLVADGARVPHEATWLVVREPVSAWGCRRSWARKAVDARFHWRLLQRTAPDTCGARARPL